MLALLLSKSCMQVLQEMHLPKAGAAGAARAAGAVWQRTGDAEPRSTHRGGSSMEWHCSDVTSLVEENEPCAPGKGQGARGRVVTAAAHLSVEQLQRDAWRGE